jgi:hypothetical protein
MLPALLGPFFETINLEWYIKRKLFFCVSQFAFHINAVAELQKSELAVTKPYTKISNRQYSDFLLYGERILSERHVVTCNVGTEPSG